MTTPDEYEFMDKVAESPAVEQHDHTHSPLPKLSNIDTKTAVVIGLCVVAVAFVIWAVLDFNRAKRTTSDS